MTPWALQQALLVRLTGYAPLMALVTGIHDHAPQDDTTFPYVQIGEETGAPFDTDTSVGAEMTVTIHVWSRYRGMKEIKQIQGVLHEALHRYPLPVAGAHTVTVEWETSGNTVDPDGLTRHGTMTFRIILERTEA